MQLLVWFGYKRAEVSSGAVGVLSMSMAIATCQAGEGGQHFMKFIHQDDTEGKSLHGYRPEGWGGRTWTKEL